MGNKLAQTSRHWVFTTVRRDWDRTHLNRAAGDQVSDVQLVDLRIVNNREKCIWVYNGPDIYQTVRMNAGRESCEYPRTNIFGVRHPDIYLLSRARGVMEFPPADDSLGGNWSKQWLFDR
jgi:hypothetical protein